MRLDSFIGRTRAVRMAQSKELTLTFSFSLKLGDGHHFRDAEIYRFDKNLSNTPMDLMIQSVTEQGLLRPKY